MAKSILYVGPHDGTSRHRYEALKRLGHRVDIVDPFRAISGSAFWPAYGFKAGYFGLEGRITRYVLGQVPARTYDVVWVDNGETVGRQLVAALKKRCGHVVNHNLDNPFTGRDGLRWRLFLAALPLYSLFVTPRKSSQEAALAAGVPRAVVMMQTADEQVHRYVELTEAERRQYGSEVVFAGTWMPERGPFLKHLVDRGVPLRIFGPRWNKSPEHLTLAPAITSIGLDDVSYVKVISGAKIAIGLLSSGNEDVHTTRSLEIPAIGTPFCAPRTPDHEALYADGREALFFSSPDECADLCLALLQDDKRRTALGAAGHARALQNGRFNERICQDILRVLE